MLKKAQNIAVGFLVSFIGSIPLGYLNLAGLEIYSKSGFHNLIFFLCGVVFVESFVIYFTLLFAKKLVKNKKLMKIIDFFSVLFMFVLAYYFYSSSSNITSKSNLNAYLMYSPFAIGVVLNCFNFLQLPFWTSWNLYLVKEKYITIEKKLKYYYIAGTLIGVFIGMLSLIVILQTVFQKTNQFSKYILPVFIPLFFILLGSIQVVKVIKNILNQSL